jgi:hypothetical protein
MSGLLIRNSFLLAKTETTYGTDPTVANTDALKIVSMEINPITGTRVERALIKGSLGADRQPLANEHVGVTITFEWGGSGVAATAPRFSPLLQSCGMNLTSVAQITGTAYRRRHQHPDAGGPWRQQPSQQRLPGLPDRDHRWPWRWQQGHHPDP